MYIQNVVNDLLGLDSNLNDFFGKNDDELAVMAKNDKNAAAVLVSRYSKLIFIKSGIYANFNTDSDDLSQEGLMGLLSAIGSYKPEKQVKFSTFAEVCIENRMKSLLAKGNRAAAPVDNIDELTEVSGASADETPESIYLYKEYFSELFSSIQSVLSPAELRIFKLCFGGASYREAAEKLGITEKSVDNAMQRARKKIRALIR